MLLPSGCLSRTAAPDPATPHNPLIYPPFHKNPAPQCRRSRCVPFERGTPVLGWYLHLDSHCVYHSQTQIFKSASFGWISSENCALCPLFKYKMRNICQDFQRFFIEVHVIFDNIPKRFKFSIDGQSTLAELEGGLTVTDAQTGYQKGFCIERSPSCGF